MAVPCVSFVCHFAILHRLSWHFLALTAPVRKTAGCPLIDTFGAGNQADAGTRTPDPIITRYAMRAREGAWLSEIAS
jgi:hypothetical protein